MRTVKSKRNPDPEIKFSSFLNKNEDNNQDCQLENQIENLLNCKNEMKNSTAFMHSGVSNNLMQKIYMQTNFSSNIKDSNHYLNSEKINNNNNLNKNKNSDKNVISNSSNNNDLQYFEREISLEEEIKLKTSLSKHFIFQDLKDEIMYSFLFSRFIVFLKCYTFINSNITYFKNIYIK